MAKNMNKKHIINEFAILVRSEAIKLKTLINPKQAAKLKFSISDNIYDQLTGNSESKESINLLNKCTTPYSSNLYLRVKTDNASFDIKNKANTFSALEVFCQLATPSQLKFVHDYLKGNLTDVNFSRFIHSLKK